MATNKRRRVEDESENNATQGAMVPPTTPASTGGETPLKVKPGDSSGSEGTLVGAAMGKQSDAANAQNKKRRLGWNAEANALGYEAGTIKNSAYVLLAQSGTTGMTVAAIVDAATKQGLYSWGTCKTPNNSVTAALSQDTTFVRIAPSTYALRSTLKGGAGPVPQPRTSSGSINSGLGRHGAASGSGLSGGAVAGGRSTLGQKAISSKARRVDIRQAQLMQQQSMEFQGNFGGNGGDPGFEDDGSFDIATEAFQMGVTQNMGYANQSANMGGYAQQDQYSQYGTTTSFHHKDLYGNAQKISSALQMESYKRRMDVSGGLGDLLDDDQLGSGSAFQVLPSTRPEHEMNESNAGSSLLWYPTANPYVEPEDKPSPLKEPTEALIRASSWKDEAKSLFSSPGIGDFESEAGLSAIGSGHLPQWVLESFGTEGGSPGAIAC